MIQAFSTSRNKVWSLIFFAIGVIMAVAALIPGLIPKPLAMVLAVLSAIALILVFVHPWRASREFLRLLLYSVIGLVVSAIFSNVFEAIAPNVGSSGLVFKLLNGMGGIFFIIAILICPAGMLVGIIGAIIMAISGRRSPSAG